MTIDELPNLPPADLADELDERVWERLRRQYRGVFDLAMLRRHVADHLGPDVAEEHVALVAEHAPSARSILDVGSGFGSFVMAASSTGYRAVGVELAPVELAHAARQRPGRFASADATRLPFPDGTFDVVTLWNVLEHVIDVPAVLVETARVLRPGGRLFVEAPNYDAFRTEAHYHVPWAPFLRGRLAVGWLRLLGRDPTFWSDDVRPCGKTAVVAALRRLGLDVTGVAGFRVDPANPPHGRRGRALVRGAARLHLLAALRLVVRLNERNPLQGSIRVVASKS